MDNCCCGMPKSSWAPPKGMRRKCERGRGSVNAGAAGAEVILRKAEVFVGVAEGYAGEV